MKIIDSLVTQAAGIAAIRRDIHAHPELAFHETRTADIVARELASYGLEVHRGLAKTGVVGTLGAGKTRFVQGLAAAAGVAVAGAAAAAGPVFRPWAVAGTDSWDCPIASYSAPETPRPGSAGIPMVARTISTINHWSAPR